MVHKGILNWIRQGISCSFVVTAVKRILDFSDRSLIWNLSSDLCTSIRLRPPDLILYPGGYQEIVHRKLPGALQLRLTA